MLEEARQPAPWPAGDTGASGQPVAVPRPSRSGGSCL